MNKEGKNYFCEDWQEVDGVIYRPVETTPYNCEGCDLLAPGGKDCLGCPFFCESKNRKDKQHMIWKKEVVQ